MNIGNLVFVFFLFRELEFMLCDNGALLIRPHLQKKI